MKKRELQPKKVFVEQTCVTKFNQNSMERYATESNFAEQDTFRLTPGISAGCSLPIEKNETQWTIGISEMYIHLT